MVRAREGKRVFEKNGRGSGVMMEILWSFFAVAALTVVVYMLFQKMQGRKDDGA